ncbi:MAG: hypothetical protein Q4F25_05080 [Eubacteriales bacterium]|nr:hypothetical protein [Eubacteriales bacterium]
MDKPLFREESMKRISSPEDLNDYLRVTGPAVWLVLTAIILLLAGMLLWSSVASIDSIAAGTGRVENGTMYIEFEDGQIAENVTSGMTVLAGSTESRISSIGTDYKGDPFALAPTTLADGTYSVKVIFRQTQVLRMLFR